MKELKQEDFIRVNFGVYCHDINGGFFDGGTSVIINLQNSNSVFISKGKNQKDWPIRSFDDGLQIANRELVNFN